MRRPLRVVAALMIACAGWLPPAIAAETPPADAVKITGKVAAKRGATGGIVSATLTTPAGQTYNVQMDERGRSFAAVMHGESPEIWGRVARRDGAPWLQVVDYTDDRVTAGHELWRRMRCLACVVLPATRNAAAPSALQGAIPIAGRFYSLKRRLTAWTRDARHLWAADDHQILQIDLDQRRVLRSFGKEEGLPDRLVYQLLSDGQALWIVHRGGVAVLKAGEDRIRDVPRLQARFARVAADAGGVWIVADTGTFRVRAAGEDPVVHPALPTAERIGKAVEDGIWWPHWARRTAHFVASPTVAGERLYVGSYGDLYELAQGRWEKIADGGWEPVARADRLWFIGAQGLCEYDPAARKTTRREPPAPFAGRCARLLMTDRAAWLVSEPGPAAQEGPPVGGGLARFDLAEGAWKTWSRIQDVDVSWVSCLARQDGCVWAATMQGRYITKSAHPGMTTTRRLEFLPAGLALHRFDERAGRWDTCPVPIGELERRLICGQDGKHGDDAIVPGAIEELSIGTTRLFAVTRLAPRQFFGGYWPCVNRVASRTGPEAPWTGAFEHRPEPMGLQGEQPQVLNISSGELTRIGSNLKDQLWEAVGHDRVLGLFAREGRHWSVTEGGVASLDEGTGSWQRIVEPEFRWYWRATAALDDGRWLYLGSDRGWVCRLDLDKGRFEFLTALRDRAIARIAKTPEGAVMVLGRQAPLGVLPVQLKGRLKPLDADAARFDGERWTAARPEEAPPEKPGPLWSLAHTEKKERMDKSLGNVLCGPAPDDPAVKPRYYLKEVFFPQFLCVDASGSRLWLSTYTGLLRVDLPKPGAR